jgi:FlaA1/EpsC-like NDP-sugar epimerase
VEACANNVFGTLNLMKFCQQHQVKRLVALSTDKAVAPTSVMGATKRVAELLLHTSGTPGFAAVRFGNVLGSRGSVIPTMQAQIAAGGPVTVTSAEMERYFMTIPEAVSLVLGAGAMATGGEIYVLEMGRPVRILDLAENLIRLSGMEPHQDIEIAFSGIRAGEKLSEVLVDEGETSLPSGWEGIIRVNPTRLSPSWPGEALEHLRVAVERGDDPAARHALFALLKTEPPV